MANKRLDLLVRIAGQMDSDNENTRDVAFRKAQAMMARDGISFQRVFERAFAQKFRETPDTEIAPTPAGHGDEPTVDPSAPYLHARLAGRFSRVHLGKSVVRRVRPPNGIWGRMRIIEHRESEGVARLIASFETSHELYEPFDLAIADAKTLAYIIDASRTGRSMRFR